MAESDDIKRVGNYNIDTSDELGGGYFGTVFKGIQCQSGDTVAAKVIPLHRSDIREYALGEVAILKLGKDHENILQILFDEIKQNELWIIMEYCDLGNLSDYAMEHTMDFLQKLDIIHQSTNGLVYLLHLEPDHVIHRDIKPANILIQSTSGTGIIVRISDFGVSKTVSGASPTQLGTRTGTEHYKAPELYNRRVQYNRSVDVFALGVLILHLIRAKDRQSLEDDEVLGDPIGQQMFYLKEKKEKWIPIVFEMDDSDAMLKTKRLIANMIVMDPVKRVSMEEVHAEIGRIKAMVETRASEAPGRGTNGMEEYFNQAASLQPLTHQEEPTISTSLPKVKKQHSQLLDYQASDYIGFGENSVVLASSKMKKIVKYTEEWSDQTPAGLCGHKDIFICPSYMVFRHLDKDPTRLLSHTFETKQTYSGDYGYLCGTLPKDRLIYAQRLEEDNLDRPDPFSRQVCGNCVRPVGPYSNCPCFKKEQLYRIKVYQLPDHGYVRDFARAGDLFNRHISVCSHQHSNWIAVVMWGGWDENHSLDIFNASYVHIKHVELQYEPCEMNAVAAVDDWIVVASEVKRCHGAVSALHFYNWHGDELKVLTNEQLGLVGQKIYGIGATDSRLKVAAGSYWNLTSIHSYEIC